MKVRNFFLIPYLFVACLLGFHAFSQDQMKKDDSNPLPVKKCTTELEVKEAIGPATLDGIQRAIERTQKLKCQSLMLLINTPGGSLQSTRLIVEEILNSPLPILCLVYPSGGHAGSAGAIILQACHVSGAMVATNIGAATPIASTGKEMPEDLRKKLINDTKSWMDGLTKLRGRNVKFGQDIITDAKAVNAKEAAEIGAIDFLAEKKIDFVNFANGRETKIANSHEVKVTTGDIVTIEHDLRHKIVAMVTDPQVAYLLFMGSLALLYFEITHPGTLVPGVVGGVGLVLSLMAMHKLNVTWGGLALLFLGVAFMIAEAFVASFGILGIGGVISFVVGSLILFDPETSGYSLDLRLILPTAILLGAATFGLAYMAFKTREKIKAGGYEDFIGLKGEVVSLESPSKREGKIEIRGEIWKFKSDSDLTENQSVTVTGHEGLTLRVEPVKES